MPIILFPHSHFFYQLFYQISDYSQYFTYYSLQLNAQKKITQTGPTSEAMSSKVGAAFFQLPDFALTGVTSRDLKAVELVDDQEEESMMCWLQYVLPQLWARLALVTPMYPPSFFRTR